MIHTDFHKASSESLSRLSLLFFFGFFWRGGEAGRKKRQITAVKHTQRHATPPSPHPSQHPSTSPIAPSSPQQRVLGESALLQPEMQVGVQKRKNRIYFLCFSMLGNKGGEIQSLLSAALDNTVVVVVDGVGVGAHF